MNKNVSIALLLAFAAVLSGCGASETPTGGVEASDGSGHAEEGEKGHAEDGKEHAEGEEGQAEGGIELTDEQIRTSGIGLVQSGSANIRQTLSLYGTIAPNAERVREVTARYPGILRSVSKRIGDTVREGETLATVESNESLRTYSVPAPLTGVVTQRKANPGEYTGDAILFTVADLSTVWVELYIFPRDAAKVRLNQEVRVRSPDSGLSADGKVVYVAPFGQTANQTLTARVLLDNADRRWAPGLYVTAEVTLAETETAIAVRNEAIQTLEGRSVVFAKTEEGFQPLTVSVGRNDNEFTEILSGLAAGQTYAAANSFILKAELGKGAAEHGH